MKCDCATCKGSGHVPCLDCDGSGALDAPIQSAAFSANHAHYDELVELQKDAQRCIKQAEELKVLQPSRAESYQQQLAATLFVIESQAEKVFKT